MANTETLNASAFAPGIGLVPSGFSNPPGLASSNVATAPLSIRADDTQSEAAIHLAGVNAATSVPMEMATAMWMSAGRTSMMANVGVQARPQAVVWKDLLGLARLTQAYGCDCYAYGVILRTRARCAVNEASN